MAGSKNLWVCFPPYKDVTDFPSLISGVHMPDLFWDNVEADGADIICYDNAGTKLKRELVSIDTVNDTMELYVKCSRSATSPTYVRINYDDAAGAETNDTDTWRAADKMIHHMADDPDNTAIADSTVNGIDGTKKGAAEPAEEAGIFDGDLAQDFDGTDDYIDLPGFEAAAESDHAGSLRFVVKFDELTTNNELLCYTDMAQDDNHFALYRYVKRLRLTFRNDTSVYGDNYMTIYTGDVFTSTAVYYHAALTSDGSTLKLYINGNLQGTGGGGNNIGQWFADLAASNYSTFLGKFDRLAGPLNYLGGLMAEARYTSGAALSADWIAAESRNLLDNANDHYVMPIYNNHIRTNNLPGKLSALGY
jgi:hypothetical protein